MGRNTRKIKIKSWGYHLTLEAARCDPESIRSKSTIAEFTKVLVKEINMVAFGKPRIVKFGKGNQAGYTMVQLIETSDITAHFVDETNDIYLDVFSCKTFNPAVVIPIVKRFFNPKKISKRFVTRQAPIVDAET